MTLRWGVCGCVWGGGVAVMPRDTATTYVGSGASLGSAIGWEKVATVIWIQATPST